MSNNLSERLLLLINIKVDAQRRFKEMEKKSGIGSDRWSAFSLGRQRPTAEMIEAAGKIWPEHAFWLLTGIEDQTYGHLEPSAKTKYESELARIEFEESLKKQLASDKIMSELADQTFINDLIVLKSEVKDKKVEDARFSRWQRAIELGGTNAIMGLESEYWMDYVYKKKKPKYED
jgi:hypothetical protein